MIQQLKPTARDTRRQQTRERILDGVHVRNTMLDYLVSSAVRGLEIR